MNINDNHKKNYTLIQANPQMCLPALLESIILSHQNVHISQEEIAEYLGIHVPSGYDGSIKNIVVSDDPGNWGVILKEDSINNLFLDKNIMLEEKYIPINELMDWQFQEAIEQSLEKGDHIIVGYLYSSLFGSQFPDTGHVSIIVSMTNGGVCIFDPGPDRAGIKEVDLYDLYSAVRSKKAGLWLFF